MKKLFTVSLLLSVFIPFWDLNAQDFSVRCDDGTQMYFNVINFQDEGNFVEVTYKGSAFSPDLNAYKGVVVIPSFVTSDGVTYEVARIGQKAFAGSEGLVKVVMADGIRTIDEFAFDGCEKLECVVFPANQVEIKEGAFFRCPSINKVVYGNDWTVINFNVFKWSRQLTHVEIPAMVGNIQNTSLLRYLQHIEVAKANRKFASVDGVLYNKRRTVLYECPLAYSTELKIDTCAAEIFPGALKDCHLLPSVVFPASIKSVSPDVLAGTDSLKSITFTSDVLPMVTSRMNGKQVFAISHPNAKNIKVYVPSKLVKHYKKGMKWGVFNNLEDLKEDGNITEYRGDRLIPKKNIKKIPVPKKPKTRNKQIVTTL